MIAAITAQSLIQFATMAFVDAFVTASVFYVFASIWRAAHRS